MPDREREKNAAGGPLFPSRVFLPPLRHAIISVRCWTKSAASVIPAARNFGS